MGERSTQLVITKAAFLVAIQDIQARDAAKCRQPDGSFREKIFFRAEITVGNDRLKPLYLRSNRLAGVMIRRVSTWNAASYPEGWLRILYWESKGSGWYSKFALIIMWVCRKSALKGCSGF
jgi:hypothetical protein